MLLVVFKTKCNKLCNIQGTVLVTLDKKAFYCNMIYVQNCTLKIIRLMGKNEGGVDYSESLQLGTTELKKPRA